MRPGWAVWPTVPRRCWTRRAGSGAARIWPSSIEHLRGHIAARRGPISEAQEILLAAAELAAPIDPDRAVVMLAEAVNASFYAGDAATMRLAADRAASLVPPDANDRTTFFALIARGNGADLLG